MWATQLWSRVAYRWCPSQWNTFTRFGDHSLRYQGNVTCNALHCITYEEDGLELCTAFTSLAFGEEPPRAGHEGRGLPMPVLSITWPMHAWECLSMATENSRAYMCQGTRGGIATIRQPCILYVPKATGGHDGLDLFCRPVIPIPCLCENVVTRKAGIHRWVPKQFDQYVCTGSTYESIDDGYDYSKL